jgi:hypothetical protein
MSMYNRRYYIHHTMKGVVKIKAKAKTVLLTEDKLSELSATQTKKLKELQSKFNYSIQLQIPTDEETPTTTKPESFENSKRNFSKTDS